MGIPYPASTDYVSDGATDMQAIADQVDLKTGLIKITPSAVSGTGASIQSDGSVLVATGGTTFTITDAFPTSFQVFQVVVNDMILSADAGINLQLRTATTTSITGYYYGAAYSQGFYVAGTNHEMGVNANQLLPRMISGTGGGGGGTLMFYNVNLAKPTGYTYIAMDPRAGGAAVFGGSGYHSVSTAYSSIVFNSGGPNFTRCRVSIYGYN